MAEMKMSISRQTLIKWYRKIADKLIKLVPTLKDEALCENANVNVDETWCRYQTRFGHKKHYIWCIVNRATKTVIFFYDEGKRNRNVLREFLGDAKINSFQSDGYNVYMYLDDDEWFEDVSEIVVVTKETSIEEIKKLSTKKE